MRILKNTLPILFLLHLSLCQEKQPVVIIANMSIVDSSTGNTITYGYSFVNHRLLEIDKLSLYGKIKVINNKDDIEANTFGIISNKILFEEVSTQRLNLLGIIISDKMNFNNYYIKQNKIMKLKIDDFNELNEYALKSENGLLLNVNFSIVPEYFYPVTYNLFCPLILGIIFLVFLIVYIIKYFIIPKGSRMEIHIDLIKTLLAFVGLCALTHYLAYIDKLDKYFWTYYSLLFLYIFANLGFAIMRCLFFSYTIQFLRGWQILSFNDDNQERLREMMNMFVTMDFTGFLFLLFFTKSLKPGNINYIEYFHCIEHFSFSIAYGILFIKPWKFIKNQLHYARTVDQSFYDAFLHKQYVLTWTFYISMVFSIGTISLILIPRYFATEYFSIVNPIFTDINSLLFEALCYIILAIIHFPRRLPRGYLNHVEISMKTSSFIYECEFPSQEIFDRQFYARHKDLNDSYCEEKQNDEIVRIPIIIINPEYAVNDYKFETITIGYSNSDYN